MSLFDPDKEENKGDRDRHEDWSKFVWKSPKEIFKGKYSLYENGIEAMDIK